MALHVMHGLAFMYHSPKLLAYLRFIPFHFLYRHSKKKKRHDSRQKERDFFLPLLERMSSSDNPRISDLDISPTFELPSLTEICLSVVLQNSLSEFAYVYTVSLLLCT